MPKGTRLPEIGYEQLLYFYTMKIQPRHNLQKILTILKYNKISLSRLLEEVHKKNDA